MPTTIYYIDRCHGDSVIEWLFSEGATVLHRVEQRAIMFQIGDGEQAESLGRNQKPDITVIPSRMAFGQLRTVGEVHFLTQSKPSKSLVSKLRRWIKGVSTECNVGDGAIDYQLEGSVKNIAQKIYVFQDGMRDLETGRYFITDDDATRDQDALCKKLRLRGVACG